jgi:ubiquinone/menaquinone biosynthesis C-methylase UbiE
MGIEDVSKHWTELGEKDPLWAVLTEAGKSGGRWDVDDFLTSGREEIADLLARLERLDLKPILDSALDFGCGAGRLTQGLVEGGFEHATGVDISAPMLRTAKEINRHPDRITFTHNQTPALQSIADASIDLVYSCRVLQHMPVHLSHGYIREFFRIARPGAVVVFQIPDKPAGGLPGMILRLAPDAVLNRLRKGMEMHGTPPEKIDEIVKSSGGQVITLKDDTAAGPRWVSHTYYCRKAPAAA